MLTFSLLTFSPLVFAVAGGYFGARLERWASREAEFRRAVASALEGTHETLCDVASAVDDHGDQLERMAESVVGVNAALNRHEDARHALASVAWRN